MSGRSAYVRKAKTKTRDVDHVYEIEAYQRHQEEVNNFPAPGRQNSFEYGSLRPTKSLRSNISGGSGDLAYARVRKPVLPPLDVSGIEKSTFRELMDKKSEGVRKGLAGISFGKKKKKSTDQPDTRPQTSNTIRPIPYDQVTVVYDPPQSRQRQHQRDESGESRPGPPPNGKLPALPPSSQLKRWQGAGRPAHPWNKLKKDPEIWDPNGDTLIFLGHESHTTARPPPSFRVSSHVLEATESKYFARMLREGYTDVYSDSEIPPSPISSAGGYFRQQRNYRPNQPSPPISENGKSEYGARSEYGKSEYGKSEYGVAKSDYGGRSDYGVPKSEYGAKSDYGVPKSEYGAKSDYSVPKSEYGAKSDYNVPKSEYGGKSDDVPHLPSSAYGGSEYGTTQFRRPRTGRRDAEGQISYELFFPAPINQSKFETLRYHATTRNVFALLYQASFVGLDLLQALMDLHERLRMYMSPEADSATLIIDYITNKRIDDPRNDPETALSLLVWSEGRNVRWKEGWQEFFVHCGGMHNMLARLPEYRMISGITKALLERSSLEMEVRLSAVADRLVEFNFADMWQPTQLQPQVERLAYERLRQFLKGFYDASFGSWPPSTPAGEDTWLTKDVAKRLQDDFGAVYDYLVNREVIWESSEERSSRKWNIISKDLEKALLVDTIDLPLTDMLVAFDSRNRYPHIPHPYTLVPDSMPIINKEIPHKSNKKAPKQPSAEDKMAERRIALAYTEATNIYILGPDFVSNKLADAFIRFEKVDRPSEVDPFAARRGRWVLIYGILQCLASVSVDTPGLRYRDDVGYHLNASLRGTPPWKPAQQQQQGDGAAHEASYCWLATKAWAASESEVPMLDSLSVSPAVTPIEKPAKLNVSLPTFSARSSIAASSGGSDIWSIGSRKIASGKPLRWMPRGAAKEVDHLGLGSGYGPGISKIDEWPTREQSRQQGYAGTQPLTDKDFDDFK